MVLLQPIRLGDRGKRAPGWLIVFEGAVRGILCQGDGDEVVLTVACDRRICRADFLTFDSLGRAHAWLSRSLAEGVARNARATRLVPQFSGRPEGLSPRHVAPDEAL